MKIKLIAEVLRTWRQDPEERALGEYILAIIGKDQNWVSRTSVEEICGRLDETLSRCTNASLSATGDEEIETQTVEQIDILQEESQPQLEGTVEIELETSGDSQENDSEKDIPFIKRPGRNKSTRSR